MTFRPDLAHLPEGELREFGGRRMRHMGDGRFVLAEEPLAKRFAMDEQETLHHWPMAS